MEQCDCTTFSRYVFIVKRAARSLIGVVLLGVLCSFVMRMFQDEIGLGSCKDVDREIQKLRAECAARKAQRNAPCHTRKAREVENRDDVGSKNMDDEIKNLIRRELEMYANDKTGMADFALENLGACVISTRDTKQLKDESQNLFGFDFMGNKHSDPNQILRPTTVPGKCWAFSGCSGTAVIRLMAFVHITHITLDHISPLMTPTGEIASAPKTFILWGLDDVNKLDGRHKFGTFVYKKEGPTVQTFPIQNSSSRSFHIVEVVFQDNQGNPYYTCVYRVRIHGKIDNERGKTPSHKEPDQ